MDADTEIAQRLSQIQNMIGLAAQAGHALKAECEGQLNHLIQLTDEVRREHLLKGETAETLACLERLDDALAALDMESDRGGHCDTPTVATLADARAEVRDLRRQMSATLKAAPASAA